MAESPTPKSPSGKVFDGRLIRRMLAYLKPYRKQFWISLLLTLLLAVLNPVKPLLFQYLLDHQIREKDIPGLRLLILLVVALLFIQIIFQYFQNLMSNLLAQSVMRDIRVKVYQHIVHLRMKYFDRNPVGALQTRTISDVETLNDVFSQGLVTIVGEILQLLVMLGVMFYIHWQLSLVVLTTLPIMLIATYIFKEKVKSSFQEVRKYVSELNSFLQEHISGMYIVQIFGREKEELKRFKKINEAHRNANIRSILYYSVFFPVVEIISALAVALLIWYGTGEILYQRLSFGTLVAFLMYIQMFFRPIRMLADQFNTLQLGMVSADRIFKILDTEDFIPDNGTLDQSSTPFPAQVDIEFKNVWFAYNEEEWVLKNVSFHVPPGKTYALVGATGSGKTSIINVLSRFYPIQSGEISIHHIPIEQFKLNWLRSQIVTVHQDVFLFSGSVKDNITLNHPDITYEQVVAAAKSIGADEFIQQLPGGYDYTVKERGATLSTGQRQLISFARALVYNPKILVLDEATSSIDTETELLIQKAIEKLMQGRTSLIIAHRLSTIQKSDCILVLHNGEIIEQGTHTELIRNNGKYRKLYELQYA